MPIEVVKAVPHKGLQDAYQYGRDRSDQVHIVRRQVDQIGPSSNSERVGANRRAFVSLLSLSNITYEFSRD